MERSEWMALFLDARAATTPAPGTEQGSPLSGWVATFRAAQQRARTKPERPIEQELGPAQESAERAEVAAAPGAEPRAVRATQRAAERSVEPRAAAHEEREQESRRQDPGVARPEGG